MKILTGSNLYSGPWVLGALLEISTDEAAGLIQTERGDSRPVTSTSPQEIGYILRQQGWRLVPEHAGVRRELRPPDGRPLGEQRFSLARWATRERVKPWSDLPCIVLAGNSWRLICGGRIGCSRVGDFVPVTQHPDRRSLVQDSITVERMWQVSAEPGADAAQVVQAALKSLMDSSR